MELIIQIIGGLLGGNAVGAIAKDKSLGSVGNSIAGALGGLGGGQILSLILGAGTAAAPDAAAAARGLDWGAIIGQLVASGAGGGIVTVIAGIIKSRMVK